MKDKPGEGWDSVFVDFVSKKSHYIGKSHRSLCGKYLWYGDVGGKDDNPDNCVVCLRVLEQLKGKETKK